MSVIKAKRKTNEFSKKLSDFMHKSICNVRKIGCLQSKKTKVSRFVLTELLAVAAIIASLPSSSYQRVKQKTYQTECTNNLRQIGQLLRMYELENGYYPKASFYPKKPGSGEDSIRVQLGGPEQLWICPALPDKLKEKGLTFVYNDAIAGKSTLKNPSKKWVLIEFNCVSKNSPHPHPGGYNILFADGHVINSKRLPRKITSKQQAK